jgi:diaminopimelate decarboxylase
MKIAPFLLKSINRILSEKSKSIQSESGLTDPGLWDLHRNESGNLAIGGMDTEDLIGTYGSPLFAVNRTRLVKDIRDSLSALEGLDTSARMFYSYKTNAIPGILKEIHSHGIGAEVISPYELWLAGRLNVQGKDIIYNGVNKTDDSLKMAIEMGIFSINVDDISEIDRIYRIAKSLNRKAHVGVRLGMIQKSQFGIELDNGEALKACERIVSLSDFLDLRCIHFNVTSNAKDASMHRGCAIKAVEFMHRVKVKTGHNVPYLDIGGGFGVPTTKNMSGYEYGIYRLTGCLPSPPEPNGCRPFASVIGEISDAIKETCRRLNHERPGIILEPGRLITSRAQILLTRINAIKKKSNGTVFVITDAGRLSTTFPCDFEYHEVLLANRPMGKPSQMYNIMGRVCTSADWLVKNKYLPELTPDDILAIMDAGAYFSSYSTNFAFQRPVIVMVEGNSAGLIRRAETFEHMIAMDENFQR